MSDPRGKLEIDDSKVFVYTHMARCRDGALALLAEYKSLLQGDDLNDRSSARQEKITQIELFSEGLAKLQL